MYAKIKVYMFDGRVYEFTASNFYKFSQIIIFYSQKIFPQIDKNLQVDKVEYQYCRRKDKSYHIISADTIVQESDLSLACVTDFKDCLSYDPSEPIIL